jgi:hypothetical protein
LLTQEDSREAIDAVKRLQVLWKETGMVPRDQEQSLWNEFRELCDAIHQRREQAYAEYAAGLEAAKAKAVSLCEEAERIAALTGSALIEGGARIAELRDAFDALGEMPRTDARALHDRFAHAVKSGETHIAQQRARDADQSVMNLIEAARHVCAYEWARAQNSDAAEIETLRLAAEAFIAGVQNWPKGGLQALKAALARAAAVSQIDHPSHEKALRVLCIRGEIHGERPTPPEDEALRREYQVQRLTREMGQGVQSDDGDWDAMALEWVRAGAVSPGLQESLQGRFMQCFSKRPTRQPGRRAGAMEMDARMSPGAPARRGYRAMH